MPEMDKQSNSTTVPEISTGMTEERARERIRVVASELARLLPFVPGAAGLNVELSATGKCSPKLSLFFPVPLGFETEAVVEDPHVKARRLSRELSVTLTDCYAGDWYACIFPASSEISIGFASGRGISDDQSPHDRCLRLSGELASALDDWREGSETKFYANVYRASSGRGVVFFNEASEDRT
jgi:hypothetical protein